MNLDNYHNIVRKLEGFSKKFYTKLLLKGLLLFIILGALFVFAVLAVEYYLWLGQNGRLILLLSGVAIMAVLLYKYILVPLGYLFRIKRGISHKEASDIIGKHFPEVGDKLYNLLDLAEDKSKSELLLASIEQRSTELSLVPFTKAVNLKENIRYVKYLTAPLLIFGLIWFSGNLDDFFGSYKRVVNYDTAYEPPAPFVFRLLTNETEVLESEPFTIQVLTDGEVQPNNVFLVLNGREYLLQNNDGIYQHQLTPPLSSASFYFKGGAVTSREYELNALKTPLIQGFEMILDFPSYLNKKSEKVQGTGNATVPEGTKVTWDVVGRNTDRVSWVTADTTLNFIKNGAEFSIDKRVYGGIEYQVRTSNENVEDYENLEYRLEVIKDAYPKVRVEEQRDSLNPNIVYYGGRASDDYGVSRIELVYYPAGEEDKKKSLALEEPRKEFQEFYYTFPTGLDLAQGTSYSFYFKVTDNDGIRNGKETKSQVFNSTLFDQQELKEQRLDNQESILKNMDNSIEELKEQRETLEELNREQKEKNALTFNDKKQIKDFLQKQKQQENMMEKFSRQLKENLEKEEGDDLMNELLKERLERQEEQARKNERLLEELEKLAEKIDKEELAKRLEELGKQQQNSERSLEQLLELTKRYYVTEKAAQLAQELEKLAERQEILSKLNLGQDFSNEEQEKLNENFKGLSKELDELKKDNQDLKKPLELDIDSQKQEGVKQDQKEALEEINKHQGLEESSESEEKQEAGNKVKQKQKSAAEKLKEMAEELGSSARGASGGETLAEDAEMLRQILDNLITFSFKQESLYDRLQESDSDLEQFAGTVQKQQQLKLLFEHVDDSLFALSLRRAELSEFVNEQITEVYYNIDKSLESIADNRKYQGVSYQQYVLNAANSLADFLAGILDNMQQSLQQGKGSGDSEGGFQLPDIIKSQQELGEKMGQSGEKDGQEGKQGEGEGEGQEKGQGNQEGQEGEGQQGQGQGEGDQGNEGENGQTGGKDGGSEDGEGQGTGQEESLQELYEIYKQQEQIRMQLEKQLEDMINDRDKQLAQKLVKQMQDFEEDLLESGITDRTRNRMNTILYQLMKLENAAMEQGQKQERKSETNARVFVNPLQYNASDYKKGRNEFEILNRQALPLRQNYRRRVSDYFNRND